MEENIERITKKDKVAFDNLINELVPYMYKISIVMLKKEEDANDAISECILKVYKNLNSLKNKKLFKTWMTRILINECKNILKRRQKIIYINDIEETGIYDNYNETQEVKQAIDKLKPDFKMAIVLFYYQDLSIAEIANIAGVPEGTVKWRLHEAKQKLLTMLNKLGKENVV